MLPAAGCAPRSRLRARARSSVGVAAKTSRTVALNWRTLEKPAAHAIDEMSSAVVSTSRRGLGALRTGQGQRPRADLGEE